MKFGVISRMLEKKWFKRELTSDEFSLLTALCFEDVDSLETYGVRYIQAIVKERKEAKIKLLEEQLKQLKGE